MRSITRIGTAAAMIVLTGAASATARDGAWHSMANGAGDDVAVK